MDQAVYVQPLTNVPMSNPLAWKKATEPAVTSISIGKDFIFGIGLDKAVWKQPIAGGNWEQIPNGAVKSLAVDDFYIYGAGMDNNVWQYAIDGSRGWERLNANGAVTSIALGEYTDADYPDRKHSQKRLISFIRKKWQCLLIAGQ